MNEPPFFADEANARSEGDPVSRVEGQASAQRSEVPEGGARTGIATGPGAGAELDPALADLEARLRRALADLDNLRKRSEREIARERAEERARVASLWLPVVDDLERALRAAAEDPGAMVEGVQAVRDHAVGVLARLGYTRFDDVGQPFDPVRHEAIGTVRADVPPGTVVTVVRPGYATGTSTLRPAGVLVADGSG